MPFDNPALRLGRLMEAVALIKRLFQENSVTFTGKHYHVQALNLQPKPVQCPYPPLYVGGGGKRILRFAAQEATIVGLATTTTAGMLDVATTTASAVAEKVRWVREAASTRLNDLELHIQVTNVVITDDRRAGADIVAGELAGFSSIASNTNLSTSEILESPHVLVGTVDQIVESLQERRERYGISYNTVFGDADMFSPVVARLAGK